MNVKSRALLVNLSLIIFSVLFACLLSEIALRLMGQEPLFVSSERERFWRYDSRLGWAHEPGQEGIFETPQFRTTVQINEKGLRDRAHAYERQDDRERVLVLGDSFAWGFGVEEAERFSQVLEPALGVEVINAGVSGYSTDQELLWYSNEGIKYDVDLVILVLAGNDVGDNERDIVSTIYYKPRFALEKGQLIPPGDSVPETSPRGLFIYSISQRSALVYFLVQRYFDVLALYGKLKADTAQASAPVSVTSTETEPFQLTIALINEIRNISESRDANFMIVTTDRWWDYPSGESYEEFLDRLQADGFLVLDVESMPGFDPVEMLIPDDGHWNHFGHQFVAEKIQAFIESHHLLGKP